VEYRARGWAHVADVEEEGSSRAPGKGSPPCPCMRRMYLVSACVRACVRACRRVHSVSMSTMVAGRGASHSQLSSTYEHACEALIISRTPTLQPPLLSLSLSPSACLPLAPPGASSVSPRATRIMHTAHTRPCPPSSGSATVRVARGMQGPGGWRGAHLRRVLEVEFNDDVHHTVCGRASATGLPGRRFCSLFVDRRRRSSLVGAPR